jgi:hypothetical protein
VEVEASSRSVGGDCDATGRVRAGNVEAGPSGQACDTRDSSSNSSNNNVPLASRAAAPNAE